jgi:hypothetical protein
MIFILLDLSPARIAEYLLNHRKNSKKKIMEKIHFEGCHLSLCAHRQFNVS